MDVVTFQAAVTAAKGTALQRWARAFGGVGEPFDVMQTPPTITFGTGTSSVDTNFVNGATRFDAQNAVFTKSGSIFVAATAAGSRPVFTPSHITDSSGVKGSQNAPIRYRFMTDATAVDFCFRDNLLSQFNILVDGQFVARDRTAVFGNTGQYRYVKLDFGTDVVTYGKAATTSITAAGSGYAVGDVITLNGGTGSASGTPATVRVGTVSGGAVTTVDVVSKGAYTTQPTGTFSQASTTGSGTGFQMSASFFQPAHSTRRMRVVELVYGAPALFLGIVTASSDAVVPAPLDANAPKVAFIGDSITDGTYLQYGAGHIGSTIAQRLGWWDKHIVSGIGGTGWNAGTTPWSHANRIQDFIDYDADAYVFIGSQNDTAGTALEAKVTSTLEALVAGRPKAYIVGIGNILGDSTTLADSIGTGFAAVTSRRVTYLNNHSPQKWMPAASATQWTVTSDANHLSQEGMDRFARISADRIAAALVGMAI